MAQERGLPPGKVLGGMEGEMVWRELAQAQLAKNGKVVDKMKIELDKGLPLMIDYVTENNGQIIFNLHEGIAAKHTPSTWLELQHILSNEERISKTVFVIDWHY